MRYGHSNLFMLPLDNLEGRATADDISSVPWMTIFHYMSITFFFASDVICFIRARRLWFYRILQNKMCFGVPAIAILLFYILHHLYLTGLWNRYVFTSKMVRSPVIPRRYQGAIGFGRPKSGQSHLETGSLLSICQRS